MAFNIMNDHKFSINTAATGATETFSPVAKGISSAEPTFNEETADDSYMDGDGFSETDIIRIQPSIAFEGHRDYEDEAQNFIYSKVLSVGAGRRTTFKWEQPDGSILTGPCTIASIEGPGGGSGEKGAISFEIRFNGKPTFTPAPAPPSGS